jgi:hypothetical protein
MTATTPQANQELAAALGGITQCRYSLRQTRRWLGERVVGYEATGMDSLTAAVDSLSDAVELLARVVARAVKP